MTRTEARPLPLVVISDLHIGCGLAIMPENGFTDDTGVRHQPSPFQEKIAGWYADFWAWVDTETKGQFNVCVNGDLIDGTHHQSVTQWTHNLDVQRQAAVALLRPLKARCRRFLVVRGTEAHAGSSGQHEEAIARELDAEKSPAGTFSHWEIYYRLGPYLVHLAHHLGTSTSPFAASSALQREMVSGYVDSGRWGDEPPAMFVRSHRHVCSGVWEPSQYGITSVAVTAAWQAKTPYVYRIAARMQQPQIGGLILFAGDNGPFAKPWVRRLARPQEV